MNSITLKESFLTNPHLQCKGIAMTGLERAALRQLEKLQDTFATFTDDVKKAFLQKCAQEKDMKSLCYHAKKLLDVSTTKRELKPIQTSKVLVWLQKARHALLSKVENKAGLLKKIGDLEAKLEARSKSFSDYKEIVLGTPPIELKQSQIELMKQEEGKGGSTTYFVLDEKGEKIGIFKVEEIDPEQEIPSGIDRQMAAYLLDKNTQGKAHVALTLKAFAPHLGQMGTIQVFKENSGTLSILDGNEIEKIPTKTLHYLTMHRLRLFERDGHTGNILWHINDKKEIELISIDHDWALPEFTDTDCLDQIPSYNSVLKAEWDDYPQMAETFDPEVKECIANLDIEAEAQMLQEMGLSLASINLFKVSNWILQEAVRQDFTVQEAVQYFKSTKPIGEDDIMARLMISSPKQATRFGYLRHMIATQHALQKQYKDPQGSDRENYDQKFASAMKSYISDDMTQFLFSS